MSEETRLNNYSFWKGCMVANLCTLAVYVFLSAVYEQEWFKPFVVWLVLDALLTWRRLHTEKGKVFP